MTRNGRKLILGSSSRWRAQVLMRLGATFEVMSPDIDEKAVEGRCDDPVLLTYAVVSAKIEALLARVRGPAIIICADQVAVWNGETREKPADAEEARRWLRDYGGGSVETCTAVAVADASRGLVLDGTDWAKVFFRPIPEAAIEAAVARGDVLHSCGAFTIDDPDLAPHVERIEGEKESVDGLPLALTRELLACLDDRL